jgi:hypothetical protein
VHVKLVREQKAGLTLTEEVMLAIVSHDGPGAAPWGTVPGPRRAAVHAGG